MAVMLAKTYEAFVAAGAPEEKAVAAAEELFAKIDTDLAVLKWMLAATFAGVVSLTIKAFA